MLVGRGLDWSRAYKLLLKQALEFGFAGCKVSVSSPQLWPRGTNQRP